MQGIKEWQKVSLFHCVICFVAGCGTQAGTAVTAMYDSSHERYGTSDELSANATEHEVNSETGDGHRVNLPSEPATQSTVPNAAAPPTGVTSAAGRNADLATTREVGTPGTSDVLPANSGELLTSRVVQLENQIARLQNELRQRHTDNDVPRMTSREPATNADSADSSHESLVDNSDHASDTESRRSGQPSAVARYARMDLDRLIRRYRRARTVMMRSEASYEVDHFMTLVKSFEFLVRDTPQSFNALPERDTYAFRDLQEAADDLVPELAYYLDELASEGERLELEPLLSESRQVTEMEPPGTGNRLLDFLEQLNKRDEEYKNAQ